TGDDRIGRLADECLAHPRAQAVLWRHLLSAGVAVGKTGFRRDPEGDRPRVAGRTREDRAIGRRADDAAAKPRTHCSFVEPAWRGCARADGHAVSRSVRRAARRIWRRPEVPAAERAAPAVARTC